MSSGLKKELGLGEPKPPGSTQQADNFKAAYQASAGKINGCLQYTAAHGEKSKHDPLAARRDKSCQAYQVALGRIDPTNPAVAQGAIDQVLAAVKELETAAEALRAAAEKAYNAWTAREGELSSITDKVREMIDWGHDKAAALQQVLDAITAKANERAYDAALQALEQLLTKAAPIYEDYTKQKAAQEKYEPGVAELQLRLDSAQSCIYKPLETGKQELASSTETMKQSAEAKDYVTALSQLDALKSAVEAFEQKIVDFEQKKSDYEAARQALDPKLAEASSCPYKSLDEMDKSIVDLTTRTDAAAAEEDYELALTSVGELQLAVDDKLAKVLELDSKKAEYDTERATVDAKATEASTCKFKKGFEELDQAIIDLTTKTDQAYADEKFEEALTELNNLSAKIDEKIAKVAEVEAMKADFEARYNALQTQLEKAEALAGKYDYLKPILTEVNSILTETEAFAQEDDFEEAQRSLGELEAKLAEFDAAIAAKKAEFDEAMKVAKATFDKCVFLANSYKSLEADQMALKTEFLRIHDSEEAEDYEKAKQQAELVKTQAEAYMVKAAEAQKEFDEKAAKITKELDDADVLNREAIARRIAGELSADQIKHMPIEVRNRIMQEMQKDGFSDDDKKAMDKLYTVRTLDPKFEEAERVKREELTERLKSDPEFAKTRDNWDKMSKEERVKIIEKAAAVHADVYGTSNEEPKMTVETTDIEPVKDAKGKVKSWNDGEYDHTTGKLIVNTNPYEKVASNKFDSAIEVTVHEAGHRYQNVLAERLNRTDETQLKPTDPEYNQAVAFRINDPRYGYYRQPGEPWEIYYNQPMESHSRVSGAGVSKAGVEPHNHGHHH